MEKYTLDVCQRIKTFKFIYKRKEFLARELFDKLEIPYPSGYRNLEIWRKKDLLEKPENGGGTNYNAKYKITPSWINFYEEFRRKILDILLYD